MTSKQLKYIELISEAASTHSGVAHLARRIADTMRLVLAKGIRIPNDWMFHYTGYAEFRWYDGGKTLSGANHCIGIDITEDAVTIRGRISKDKYGDGRNTHIEGLEASSAATILGILVNLIDRNAKSNTEAQS